MKPEKPVGRELSQAPRYDALGYSFAFSIMVFAGAGYLLDRWFGTRLILTIIGTLLGAGLAVVWVFLKVRSDQAGSESERRRTRSREPADPQGGA